MAKINNDQIDDITASKVSDFDTEVANNAAVTANTAKTGITPTQASNITTNNAKISYTDAAKVATIEDNADVTDTANVTSAGALMDSEVTNLAQVKAFDTTDYATAAQGSTADSASQPGHTHTASDVTDFDAEVSNNTSVAANTAKTGITAGQASAITANTAKVSYTDAAKVAGIEDNADVTDAANVASAGAIIPTGTPDGTKFLRDDGAWTAVAGGSGDLLAANNLSDLANAATSRTNLGVDAAGTDNSDDNAVNTTYDAAVTANTAKVSYTDAAKVATIETNADVTDTSNVTTAGALMDSEVTNLAQVKAFDSSDYATAAQGALADSASQATGVEDNATTDQSASELLASVGPLIFPVGAIYMSGTATNPATTFGFGTWARIEGKFIAGVDDGDGDFDLDDTGGAKDVTLTESEMPSHTHTQDSHTHTQNSHNHTQTSHNHGFPSGREVMTFNGGVNMTVQHINDGGSGIYAVETNQSTTLYEEPNTSNRLAVNQATTATNNSSTATNQSTGGGSAHENLPPYIAKYIWQRTA